MKQVTSLMAIVIALTLSCANAGGLSGSTSSGPSIAAGNSLFGAPPVCNKTTQKTAWINNAWQCVNDNYKAPVVARGSSGGGCGGHSGLEAYFCKQWNNNLAKHGGQPVIGNIMRAPGMSYNAVRSCNPFSCRSGGAGSVRNGARNGYGSYGRGQI